MENETKPVTLANKIEHLNQLVSLYSKMNADSNDYIRKNDVLSHIEWAMSHLAESIWQETLNS